MVKVIWMRIRDQLGVMARTQIALEVNRVGRRFATSRRRRRLVEDHCRLAVEASGWGRQGIVGSEGGVEHRHRPGDCLVVTTALQKLVQSHHSVSVQVHFLEFESVNNNLVRFCLDYSDFNTRISIYKYKHWNTNGRQINGIRSRATWLSKKQYNSTLKSETNFINFWRFIHITIAFVSYTEDFPNISTQYNSD